MQKKPSARTKLTEFKQKWKSGLEKTLGEAGKLLEAAQNRYKRNYDKIRRETEEIFPGHYVFLRFEKKDDKDHRRKLENIAEGSYLVKSVYTDAKTLVIVHKDNTVENVSRSHVIIAPDELKADNPRENTHPMTVNESICDYPTSWAETLPKSASFRLRKSSFLKIVTRPGYRRRATQVGRKHRK